MTELIPGQVTVADLYRELTGMRRDLAEVITGNRLAEERHNINVKDHERYDRRLRKLELGWAKLLGAAAAVSVAVSLITALVTLRVR